MLLLSSKLRTWTSGHDLRTALKLLDMSVAMKNARDQGWGIQICIRQLLTEENSIKGETWLQSY